MKLCFCFIVNVIAFSQFAFGQADIKEQIKSHYDLGQVYYDHHLFDAAEEEFQKAAQLMEKVSQVEMVKPKIEDAENLKASPKITEKKNIEQNIVIKKDLSQSIMPVENEKSSVVETKQDNLLTTDDYVVKAGDILIITVKDNPDLTGKTIIRSDGKIYFPLIDEVDVQGLTLAQLDDLLTKKLEEYIRYPDVSVSLKMPTASDR